MAKVLVYQNDNGSIEIVRPALAKKSLESESDYWNRVAEKTHSGRAYSVVDMPHDWIADAKLRSLRKAWILQNGCLCIDMNRAKKLMIDQVRNRRNDILRKLDLEFMKAMETMNLSKVQEIGQYKKQLRDLPEVLNQHQFTSISDFESHYAQVLFVHNL